MLVRTAHTDTRLFYNIRRWADGHGDSIRLDEKMHPELSNDVHFESKGFMEAVNVMDFLIRDHKVILRIRRRRWTDARTGKSFSIPIDLDVVTKGTRYSSFF